MATEAFRVGVDSTSPRDIKTLGNPGLRSPPRMDDAISTPQSFVGVEEGNAVDRQFDDYRGGGGGGFGGRGGGYDGGFAPRGGYGGRGGYGPPAGDGRGGYGGRGGLRPGDEGRQIFISNLPWRTGWPDLKDMFRECGEVIRTDVLQFPDGRSRGVATALFATEDDARRAIEMFNDYELDGRRIQVRMDRGPGF